VESAIVFAVGLEKALVQTPPRFGPFSTSKHVDVPDYGPRAWISFHRVCAINDVTAAEIGGTLLRRSGGGSSGIWLGGGGSPGIRHAGEGFCT